MRRSVHLALLIVVAFGCLVLSYVVAEFAFTWWGQPCECTSLRFIGTLCTDSCISLAGVSVSESAGHVVLALALPTLGTALAEAVLRSHPADD